MQKGMWTKTSLSRGSVCITGIDEPPFTRAGGRLLNHLLATGVRVSVESSYNPPQHGRAWWLTSVVQGSMLVAFAQKGNMSRA